MVIEVEEEDGAVVLEEEAVWSRDVVTCAEPVLDLGEGTMIDGEAMDTWLKELGVVIGPSGLAGPGAVSNVFWPASSDCSIEVVSVGAGDGEGTGVKADVGSSVLVIVDSVGVGMFPGSGEVRPPYDQSGPSGMDGP